MKSICGGNFHLNCLHNAKETTGQTVYEQLQEIYAKIADKTLSFGCKIIRINGIEETVVKFDAKGDGSFYLVTLCSSNNTHYGVSLSLSDVENIIIRGHPISLSRVLNALGDDYVYSLCSIYSTDGGSRMREYICDRDLICKDGNDAYLDDQSEQTIEAIREIICKCDHVGDGVAYMTNPAQYKCKKCGEMFK